MTSGSLSIQNKTRERVPQKLLERVHAQVDSQERCRSDVSVAIVSNAEIKRLNKKYRKKDEATDVLAFLLSDSDSKDLSGEIIIAPDKARQVHTAVQSKRSLIGLAFLHGLLHLHGYNHETRVQSAEMDRAERKAVAAFPVLAKEFEGSGFVGRYL